MSFAAVVSSISLPATLASPFLFGGGRSYFRDSPVFASAILAGSFDLPFVLCRGLVSTWLSIPIDASASIG